MTRRNLPPLAAIRVFEAAARHQNFTLAASELGMTQAAVSYQIKLLEERVGAALFVRQARGVTLSEVGARFLPDTTRALDLLSDAYSKAQGQTQETLSISVLPTFAVNILGLRLADFQQAHPEISVRMEISEQIVDLENGGFDMAIRAGKGGWAGLRQHLLLKHSFTPLLSPNLLDNTQPLKTPSDILKLPILDPTDPWWDAWLSAAGVAGQAKPSIPIGKFGSQVVEGQAAIAGKGVAILTPAFFSSALRSGELVQPFDLLGSDDNAYWLVYPEHRRSSRKIQIFRKWIEHMLADLQKCERCSPVG
ncbi:LysR substrate-binding domain-containing protein [Aliiroseovarius crassostreae]|uniref:LysR substrate-binding domain-containing protein n=1 Tax=Aliiroseovarius crassostreae TaxID=154981 RepID=UPI002201D62A|nr:LysR substrate-binding domain-containing protein [Aliiroseovarius crassostreae]UWQ08154.1 LysR family transcriptional regulator [Aliiroseovarius crassostreae]